MDALALSKLHRRITEERHAQIRLLREVAICATAAAGQVRDVRLDELENPAAIEQPDWVFDILIELALGTFASKLGKKLVDAMSARVVMTRMTRGFEVEKLPAAAGDRIPKKVRFDHLSDISVEFRKLTADETKRLEWWRELAYGISGFAITKAKTEAKKPQDKPQRKDLSLPAARDRPAVVVELSVQRACAIQEAAIGNLFDDMERSLADPELIEADAIKLDNLLVSLARPLSDDYEQQVRGLRLFFESCIWCLAYPKLGQSGFKYESPLTSGFPSRGPFQYRFNFTVSWSLLAYLVQRLPHPAGDGIESFAEFDYNTTEFKEPESDWKQGTSLGVDRTGSEEVPHYPSVPARAYYELAGYFNDLASETDNIQKRLNKSFAKVQKAALEQEAASQPWLPYRPDYWPKPKT